MPTLRRKMLGPSERPWACRREYQRFFGAYVLEERCGIWLAEGMSPDRRERLVNAFLTLPEQMLELSRTFELTVSTCPGWTANGDSSTFYADFRAGNRSRISPHIEVGEFSFREGITAPHVIHETGHLWWRHLKEAITGEYVRFLCATTTSDTVEVTDYVQRFLDDWRRALEIPDHEPYAAPHRRFYLWKWAEESFCDTVSVLRVPTQSSLRRDCNVDLDARRRCVFDITELRVDALN